MYGSYKNEKKELIHWILTGELPSWEDPTPLTKDEEKTKVPNKIKSMEGRQEKTSSNKANFVNKKQLENLLEESGHKCCITGWDVYWHDPKKRSHLAYYTLTFDHIKPLSSMKDSPTVWAGKNFQIMSFAMNVVKGEFKDEELKRWLENFVRAHTPEP